MITLCMHDISIDTCGVCKPRPQAPAPARRTAPGPWFEARFGGTECAGCEEIIFRGDQIRSDGEGGWLCTGCGNLA